MDEPRVTSPERRFLVPSLVLLAALAFLDRVPAPRASVQA
jgi:hypothetical protein